MTHTYKIHGMTCNGCRSHVEQTLNSVKGVSKTTVDLDKAEAVIEMENHIPLEVFQKALADDGGRYSISMTDGIEPAKETEAEIPAEVYPEPSRKAGITYKIYGMTCNGCRGHIEQTLNEVEDVLKTSVNLEKGEAIIEMENHIPLEVFQKALEEDGGSYSISMPGDNKAEGEHKAKKKAEKAKNSGPGTYYRPMHCEGEKTYDKPGDCPVCGMDLVKEAKTTATATKYTCPMHPEVVSDEPGSCPK